MNYEIEGNRIKLDRAELLTQLIEDYGLNAETLQEAFKRGSIGLFYKTDTIPMIDGYDSMSEEEHAKIQAEYTGNKRPYFYTATKETEIVTEYDGIETINTAKPGDVISVGKKGERYVIKKEDFEAYYAKDGQSGEFVKIEPVLGFKMDDSQFSVYSKNQEMFDDSKTTEFSITPPWGGEQTMSSGSFLVCNIKNPQAHDSYFCGEEAFTSSYASPEVFNKKFNASVEVPTAEEFIEMAKEYDREKTKFLQSAQEQEAAEATEAQAVEKEPQEPVAEEKPEEVTEATRETENPNVQSESKADDYRRTVAFEHKENMYKNVIDAIPELAKESETITGAEKEKVVDEPEQSSQSKETIASKLKEIFASITTRLNAMLNPEIRDFSKQIKRFSEMSESGEIKSDPYGDLSDVQREQVDGIVRILSDNTRGTAVPDDEKMKEFVAIALRTFPYYDGDMNYDNALESAVRALNGEFKDITDIHISREGVEQAKSFATATQNVSEIERIHEINKDYLSDSALESLSYEDALKTFHQIQEETVENRKPRISAMAYNGNFGKDREEQGQGSSITSKMIEHSESEHETPDVKTGRFNPHHRTV